MENLEKIDLASISEKRILASIAVSLKRIADVMTAPPPVLADIPEELREEWEKANAAMVASGNFVEFKR